MTQYGRVSFQSENGGAPGSLELLVLQAEIIVLRENSVAKLRVCYCREAGRGTERYAPNEGKKRGTKPR